MGIPFTSGRKFNAAESAGEVDVVIVNQTLARRHFGEADPVGRRMTVVSQTGPVSREIVGVIGDVRHAGLASTPRAEVYVPLGADPWSFATVVISGSGDAERWRAAIGAQLARLDPALPPGPVRPMTQLISTWLAPLRFQMFLVSLFAVLALVLAGVGIYGVIGFLVGSRTNEIGVRMALGADDSEVFRLFLHQGLGLAGAGLVLGLAGAAVLVRFVRSFLFQVPPYDPVTFVGISVLVLAVAAVASYLPARRATAVDAVQALRTD
ncbi:MAG: ABC transporter permease [Gemmatimonadetes bacterium]|nr:ABC transporter permease [Gemmatimonadota bacterium]